MKTHLSIKEDKHGAAIHLSTVMRESCYELYVYGEWNGKRRRMHTALLQGI